MGQPIPSREKEVAASQSGALKVMRITDLPPEEQQELAKKHGVDLGKLINQQQSLSETSANGTKELTPDIYKKLKEEGIADSAIRKEFGIKSPNELTNWKKQHGLEGFRIKPSQEDRIVINEKSDAQYQQGFDPNDLPIVKQLREEIRQKDEKYQQLLTQANKARLEAEAKVENLERRLEEIEKRETAPPADIRGAVVQLMNEGEAAVDTVAELKKLADVLDKLEMPWAATLLLTIKRTS